MANLDVYLGAYSSVLPLLVRPETVLSSRVNLVPGADWLLSRTQISLCFSLGRGRSGYEIIPSYETRYRPKRRTKNLA